MAFGQRVLTMAAIVLLGGCEAKPPPAPAKPQAETWRYSHEVDQMTGKSRYLACLRSDDEVQLSAPYTPAKGVLCLVRDPRAGSSVTLSLDGEGQIVCAGEACEILARFDDGNPVTYHVRHPSDGSTNAVVFPDLLESSVMGVYLTKARKTRFELEFYRDGRQVLVFNTAGFDFGKTGWDGQE